MILFWLYAWNPALGLIVGGFASYIALLFLWSYIVEKTYENWQQHPKSPFWGCRWWSHPWQYRYFEPKIPDDVTLPPRWVFGVNELVRAACGERNYRFCPCCQRLQIRQINFSGSITDPPAYYWVDTKNSA